MREPSALSELPGVEPLPSVNPRLRVKATPKASAEDLFVRLRAGDRVALARAITAIESTRPEDRVMAESLVDASLPFSGQAVRIGVTGVPGVGKSTFLEALGTHLTGRLEQRVAVLAVDPSSERSGGSILGDKSRMSKLASDPRAYVRPSPSRGSLGGVTRKTRETLLVCEAAGFDVLFVETVGVGQSEVAVHSMVDCFLLLMLAGAGDELQGMKRGIMEMADVLAITKVDGENRAAARIAQANYRNALHLFPRSPTGWTPPVALCSAMSGEGIVDVWFEIQAYLSQMRRSGAFEDRRAEQAVEWMHAEIHDGLTARFYADPELRERMRAEEVAVRSGQRTAHRAAQALLAEFREGVR